MSETITLFAALAVFLVVGALAALAGAAARRLGGGPALCAPTCRACGALARGSGTSAPARCSECGTDTTGRDALRWVRVSRSLIVRLFTVCVFSAVVFTLVLMAGAVVLFSISRARESARQLALGPTTPAPTATEFVAAVTNSSADEWLRFGDYLVEPALLDRDTAKDALQQLLQREGRLALAVVPRLAIAVVSRDAAQGDLIRAALADRLPQIRVMMTPRVRPGAEVTIGLVQQTNREEAWMGLMGVTLNGVAQNAVGPNAAGYGARGQRSSFWRFPAPAEPGTYDIAIDWWADWPIRVTDDVITDRGLCPRRATLHRRLVVSDGPELLPPVSDVEPIDLLTLIEPPWLWIRMAGRRSSATLRFQNVPVRFEGTWLIAVDDRWIPLLERDEHDVLDIGCTTFVDAPAGGWSDRVRVRFAPSAGPVTARTLEPNPNMRMAYITQSRALDTAWTLPAEFVFKQTVVNGKLLMYELESVHTGPLP